MHLSCPANREVLAYLGRKGGQSPSAAERGDCPPHEVADPYRKLGAHPDLVERLWDELGGALPRPCRWVARGTPALAHPDSGVLFGFAGGTVYALRLPPAELADAIAAGAVQVRRFPAYPALGVAASSLDLRDLGPGWVFGSWHAREPAWCLAGWRAAQDGGKVWQKPGGV